MRVLSFLFLLLLTAAVAAFAYFNFEPVTIRFADQSVTASLAVVAGAVYLLGMLSGWALVRLVRRTANVVIDSIDRTVTYPRA